MLRVLLSYLKEKIATACHRPTVTHVFFLLKSIFLCRIPGRSSLDLSQYFLLGARLWEVHHKILWPHSVWSNCHGLIESPLSLPQRAHGLSQQGGKVDVANVKVSHGDLIGACFPPQFGSPSCNNLSDWGGMWWVHGFCIWMPSNVNEILTQSLSGRSVLNVEPLLHKSMGKGSLFSEETLLES